MSVFGFHTRDNPCPILDNALHTIVREAFRDNDRAAATEANIRIVEKAKEYTGKTLRSLGIKRLANPSQKIAGQNVDLDQEMTKEVAYMLAAEGAAGLTLEFDQSGGAPLSSGDKTRLRQALYAGADDFGLSSRHLAVPGLE